MSTIENDSTQIRRLGSRPLVNRDRTWHRDRLPRLLNLTNGREPCPRLKSSRKRRKCSNVARKAATDPISRQHYKEMAAHYRSLAVEHLNVQRDEPAH